LYSQELLLREFQDYYNFERYHESLGQKTPGSIYISSQRGWSGKLKPLEYPDSFKVAKVASCGKMHWGGKAIYIGRILSGENVGVKEEENGYTVYFGGVFLGMISENNLEVKRRPQRRKIPGKY
jgi:putative transposase